MKDSFILYLEQKEIFETLSDNEAGKLIKAIFEYESTGQSPKLSKTLNLVFIPIKNALDRNKEKYQKVVERNKKNIRKRWNKENTKSTSGKNGIQKNTKNTDNEHDNDNDNEHDNDNDNERDSDSAHDNDSVSDSDVQASKEKVYTFLKGFGNYDS